MPRKPRQGDFIPKHLITSEALLEEIRATTPNASAAHGRWGSNQHKNATQLLLDKDNDWMWTHHTNYGNPITPEDILGPDKPDTSWLKPGMWVEVYEDRQQRWYVGTDKNGRHIVQINSDNATFVPLSLTSIHPIPDPVQAALSKLKDRGIEVGTFEERTVQTLNDLGLLKE